MKAILLLKRAIKLFFSSLLIIIIAFILFLNLKLYYQPHFLPGKEDNVNADLLKQLSFLKNALHGGAATQMQQAYPEGFIFMQAVYGLSWAEVAIAAEKNTTSYKEAHEEIEWANNAIQSNEGKDRFDQTLPLPYGAYYTGWRNYLLGKKLLAEQPAERDSLEIMQFISTCRKIDSIIQITVYPESYKNFSWPADVFVAVASLSLHDKLFEPVFQQTIHEWLTKVKANTDINGFIPYAVAINGTPVEIARGSSQGLILNFLIDMDTAFARQQFDLYKNKFLDHRFGLPGIREFPKGNENTGDVDSGPVILDMGSAATIVGMRVFALYHDPPNAIAVRNGIEAFGIPLTGDKEKKYLLGKWPMADVFIAWAHTTEINKQASLNSNENWRWNFQLYSLVILMAIAIMLRLLLKKNKKASIISAY